ncbi:MAG: hypothetical protein A3F91_07425 [Flavobacteria bacterium RIFCSPLOWO2_12_FULL_35_11]|nr:MAG: hypothetical protein A3F91_07425 [Flavobacteria bacterium RIFCSPLOWO2_12_FULL_35_11]
MKKLAQVFHFDLYGKREDKYDFLNENSLATIAFAALNPQEPELFFVPKDFDSKSDYDEGFKVNELLLINNVGIVTAKDAILVNDTKADLINKVEHFYEIEANTNLVKRISYRPFDDKYIYYDTKIVERTREKVMQHFLKRENIGLIIGRQGQVVGTMPWNLSFITNTITDFNMYYRGGGMLFPLYLYPETNAQQTLHGNIERTPNLNLEIVKQFADGLALTFTNEKTTPPVGHPSNGWEFAPIDVLDYIYAVLHSPTYREKYAAFLKIDFPRVPYPKDKDLFWQLVKLGGEIRQIHLLESAVVEKYMTQYPIDGNNIVVKPNYKNGNVYLNENQYFANVPEVAWNFYIGGYQPAQKWLKDRKGRELSTEDIFHYQKIIVALSETDRIMKEIDKIDF